MLPPIVSRCCRAVLQVSFLTLLFILVLNSTALAQVASIKGHISTTDQEPAMGVSVGLEGTTLGAITDAQGNYHINRVKPGTYTIKVQMLGLEPQEQHVLIEAGKAVNADFVLSESSARIKEVVIRGRQSAYEADLPSESLRLQTPLLETSQNIQVVTKQVISDQQLFNAVEGIQRNVSGISRYAHWDNVYPTFYIRGSRVAYGSLRNGMLVANYFSPLSEDMSFVERVEFIKGPAGFMVANTEPGGTYNVVTKRPTGVTKNEVSLTTGSFGTVRAATDFDGVLSQNGKLLYRLNLMGQHKNSFVDYDFNTRYAVHPVLKYLIDDKTSVTAEYTYQYNKFLLAAPYQFSSVGFKDVDQSFFFGDPSLEPNIVKDHSGFLNLEHRLHKDWLLNAQLSYNSTRQEGQFLWPFGIDEEGNVDRYLYREDLQSESFLGQVFVNGSLQTGGVKHSLLAGLDMGSKSYMLDYPAAALDTTFNIYSPSYGLATDAVPAWDHSAALRGRADYWGSYDYAGLYLQDELHLFEDKLRFTIGGRYTYTRKNDHSIWSPAKVNAEYFVNHVFTPRLGASINVTPNSSVYALYDKAFVEQSGFDFEGNAFAPLEGLNLEAGYKAEIMNGRFSTTLAAFRITKQNALIADVAHPSFSIQTGELQSEGVEVDLKGELLPGLNMVLNYAYTDSEISKDESTPENVGTKTPGVAAHITNGWFTYRFRRAALKGAGLSFGYQYQADRYANGPTKDYTLPDNYMRLDAGVSWQNSRFSAALLVNNLTDEYLYSGDAPGYWGGHYAWQPEPPRNWRLTLGYKF